jgi:uncharacterized protein (TIGR02611 family)
VFAVAGDSQRRSLDRARSARERIRSRPSGRIILKIVVGLAGTALVALGLALVPLPGPGWLIVIIGLAVLSTEFAWADRLLDMVRRQVGAWTHWITEQSWPVRFAVSLATAVFVGCVLWATFAMIGVPAWIPDGIVPPLPGLKEG